LTKFADQLFADLMHEHEAALRAIERPAAPKARAARPVWVTSGALAASAAAAAGFVVLGGGSPAYAVTRNTDGTVTISLHELSGIDGANAKLHSLGLPVAVVPVRAGCAPVGSLAARSQGKITASATVQGDGSVTVDVKGVPPGETALATFGKDVSGKIEGSIVLIKGKAPSCVSMPEPSGGGAGAGTSQAGN
jgi:hypothetical protein